MSGGDPMRCRHPMGCWDPTGCGGPMWALAASRHAAQTSGDQVTRFGWVVVPLGVHLCRSSGMISALVQSGVGRSSARLGLAS